MSIKRLVLLRTVETKMHIKRLLKPELVLAIIMWRRDNPGPNFGGHQYYVLCNGS